MLKLNTYLTFDGNTEEAMRFYQSVFGGEFTHIMRYKDMPQDVSTSDDVDSDEMAEKIMHMQLAINENMTLMANDCCGVEGPLVKGNQYAICITPDSEQEAKRLYKSLSEGGEVQMPLEEQFWGSLFGMVKDKYEIDWLIDYDLKS